MKVASKLKIDSASRVKIADIARGRLEKTDVRFGDQNCTHSQRPPTADKDCAIVVMSVQSGPSCSSGSKMLGLGREFNSLFLFAAMRGAVGIQRAKEETLKFRLQDTRTSRAGASVCWL